MQSKENKTLVIIFRICIFAAFFTGLMYFVNFVSFGSVKTEEQAVRVINGFCGFFYAYMVFSLVSLVLSIVCFKTTSTVSSVIRTISLAVTSIILLMNISFIRFMNDFTRAESGDYDRLAKLNRDMEKVINDPAVAAGKSLLSFATVFVMLILAITSVVALVKALKGKAKPADAA